MEEDHNPWQFNQFLAALAATDYSDLDTTIETHLANTIQIIEAARHFSEIASTYPEERAIVLELIGWYRERFSQYLETQRQILTAASNWDDTEDSADSVEIPASDYSQVEEEEVEEESVMNLDSSPGSPELPANDTSESNLLDTSSDYLAHLSPALLQELQEYREGAGLALTEETIEEILSLARHLEESAVSALPNMDHNETSAYHTDMTPSDYSEDEADEEEGYFDLEELEHNLETSSLPSLNEVSPEDLDLEDPNLEDLNPEDPTYPVQTAVIEHLVNGPTYAGYHSRVASAIDYLDFLSPIRQATIREWMHDQPAPLQVVLDFARSLCLPSDPFPPNTGEGDGNLFDLRYTWVAYIIPEDEAGDPDTHYDADVENNIPFLHADAPEVCETPVLVTLDRFPNILLSHCQHKRHDSDFQAEGELITAARARGDDQCMVCYLDWTGCCLNTVPVACTHCGNHICESCRNTIVRSARWGQDNATCPYCRRSMGSVVPRWIRIERRSNVRW